MLVTLPRMMEGYKKCALGIDLPAQFFYDLQGISTTLYPFFCKYKTLWEQIIQNEYEGDLEDPRYTINKAYGEVNFGFVLTDGEGRPIEDGSWHILEYSWPHGFGHVCKLESTDPGYLRLFLNRLKLQSDWDDRYGRLGSNNYQKYLDQLDEEARERHQQEQQEMMDAIHDENKWLLDRAAENFASGKTAPTNPTKETIYGFSNQSNKTKTVRLLSDEDPESGIVLPN